MSLQFKTLHCTKLVIHAAGLGRHCKVPPSVTDAHGNMYCTKHDPAKAAARHEARRVVEEAATRRMRHRDAVARWNAQCASFIERLAMYEYPAVEAGDEARQLMRRQPKECT